MKLMHLALVGLGLYVLTRSASATSLSSASPRGSTGRITDANQLPEGILRTGQQGIYTHLIPTQIRANAFNDLKREYQRRKAQSGATALQHAYQSMTTRLAAQRVSGIEESYAPAMAHYNSLVAQYQATVKPIGEWYLAEKEKLQELYR